MARHPTPWRDSGFPWCVYVCVWGGGGRLKPFEWSSMHKNYGVLVNDIKCLFFTVMNSQSTVTVKALSDKI